MGNGESSRSRSAKRNTGLAVCLAIGLGLSQNALAYDEPNLNLGLTSFLDGGLPAGPGFYAVEYLQIYSADKLKGINLPKTDVDAVVSLTQFAYLSKAKIGTASLGLDVIVPVVLSANTDDGLGNTVLKSKTGVGDVLIGPFLQFDPIMGKNGPLLIHRIEFQVLAPVGHYDNTAAVQPGSNFWSFNPYWAGTLFLTPEWTVSGRFHYLWNGKNDNPNASLAQYVPANTLSSSRAGQAFHVNFATEYAVTKQLRVGINGYYLQQTTDTEVNDIAVAGRKEKVVAIGPGFTYSWGPDQNFFFNAYKEFDAENRPEGERFVVRYVHHF
jgi:hypothetical protein